MQPGSMVEIGDEMMAEWPGSPDMIGWEIDPWIFSQLQFLDEFFVENHRTFIRISIRVFVKL